VSKVLNIAHRGGGGLKPENSIEAFENALQIGVDGVEFDVHLWEDELVVVHDDPTGWGHPTMREVLDILKPTDVLIYAECKAIPKSYPGIAERMVLMLEEFGLIGRSIFASFDHDRVVEAKQLRPELKAAVLSSIRIHDPGAYVRSLGADIYALGVHAAGLRSVSGKPDPAPFESCDAGAAGIFTDYPDRLKDLLTRRPS
jgi:glycerophosphoryl diester phosphodiesterase